MCKSIEDRIIGGMFGAAVGEAEAITRAGEAQKSWAGSTGLCLCMADGFLCGKTGSEIIQNFADFADGLKFVPPQKEFYIGEDVKATIEAYRHGGRIKKCCIDAESSGYGSVVRMIPVAVYLGDIDFLGCELGHREMKIIHDAVTLTHKHPVSIVSCAVYVTVGRLLLGGFSSEESIYEALRIASRYYSGSPFYRKAFLELKDLYNMDIFRLLPEIVIYNWENSLRIVEAAIWCLINSDSYEECLRRAKHLGGAAGPICSAAGGLAGLRYGIGGIPKEWLRRLRDRSEIKEISEKMAEKFR